MNDFGFTFNGHHLSEFGGHISARDVSPSQKKQVLGTVPYMSGNWDFSSLYGPPAYEDRTIKYTITTTADSIESLSAAKQALENWLLPCHRSQLIDDAQPDTYYTAECLSVAESDAEIITDLVVTFSACPFRKSVRLYSAAYTPSAAVDVTANNTGTIPVVPTITCAAAATVIYGGNTYALAVGDHTDDIFELAVGNNTFNVTSDAAVTISWRTEVI